MIHTTRATRSLGWRIAGLGLLGLVGCTTVTTVEPYKGGALPRPDRILVYEFAYSASQVRLTRGIEPEVARALSGKPLTGEQIEVGVKVARVLAGDLIREIRKMGLAAERGYGDPQPLGDTYSIEGQFLSIDEGNRTERVVIGLGLGRSDVKTLVQLYRDSEDGQSLIEALDVDAKSGRKPGAAELLPAGALAGTLVVASAVTATTTMGDETFSANVDADARRTARDIAKKLHEFFDEQGWVDGSYAASSE